MTSSRSDGAGYRLVFTGASGAFALPPFSRAGDRLPARTAFEDLAYAISLGAGSPGRIPQLYIQDRLVDAEPQVRATPAGAEWVWPEARYFRRCFGGTAVRIEFGNDQVVDFLPVEVAAGPDRADEARRMLAHVASRSPPLLHACFGRSRAGGAWGGNSPGPEPVLAAAQRVIEAIERLLYSPFRRVRTRLVERMVLRSARPGDLIDDRSIAHLLQHLDRASDRSGSGGVSVESRGRTISIDPVLVVDRAESTDVYENRIVHGALRAVEARLLEVSGSLKSARVPGTGPISPGLAGGHVTFRSICEEFLREVLKGPATHCEELLGKARRCRRQADRAMPARPTVQRPHLTPVFASSAVYARVHRAACDWFDLGDGLADLSVILPGLRTLDRLYEYVCLVSLLETFEENGWIRSAADPESEQSEDEEGVANRYVLDHPDLGRTEVLYEPAIHADLGEDAIWGLRKVAGSGELPHAFRPDFAIRVTTRSGIVRRAVLDAKLASHATVRDTHLAAVALKYLHGIQVERRPGESPFDHLWLLAPERPDFWTYQRLAPLPGTCLPSVGILAVVPGEQNPGLGRWYRQVLLPSLRPAY